MLRVLPIYTMVLPGIKGVPEATAEADRTRMKQHQGVQNIIGVVVQRVVAGVRSFSSGVPCVGRKEGRQCGSSIEGGSTSLRETR